MDRIWVRIRAIFAYVHVFGCVLCWIAAFSAGKPKRQNPSGTARYSRASASNAPAHRVEPSNTSARCASLHWDRAASSRRNAWAAPGQPPSGIGRLLPSAAATSVQSVEGYIVPPCWSLSLSSSRGCQIPVLETVRKTKVRCFKPDPSEHFSDSVALAIGYVQAHVPGRAEKGSTSGRVPPVAHEVD